MTIANDERLLAHKQWRRRCQKVYYALKNDPQHLSPSNIGFLIEVTESMLEALAKTIDDYELTKEPEGGRDVGH